MSEKKTLVIFTALLILISCSPVRKVAKTYVEDTPGLTLLVLKPAFVYKTSLKDYEIEGADTLSESELDSVLYYNSLFLKEIDDSVFIERHVRGYVQELRKLGFEVYRDQEFDTFMSLGKEGYIINLAQISLEEYVYAYVTDAMIMQEVVSVSGIDLNALNIDTWFEFNSVNLEESESKVFYVSDYIFDDLNGRFIAPLFSADVKYEFTIDTIKIDTLYSYMWEMGAIYAGYTNDYFLNKHIRKLLPETGQQDMYFHYDRKENRLRLAGDFERFIEIKDNN